MSGHYDHLAPDYTRVRRPDPRIDAAVGVALGDTTSVINVGAGTGSYEPSDRFVVAIEPATSMVRQRSSTAAPVVRALAEDLPFCDDGFETAMAVLTIHHWQSVARGLEELCRVARDRIVLVTWDPESSGFWLVQDYFPQILMADRESFPTLSELRSALGPMEVTALPIPHDCTDGFLGAYWRRPQAFLDEAVRKGISAFSRVSGFGDGLHRLEQDLATGAWKRRYGTLLHQDTLDIGYRIVIANLAT